MPRQRCASARQPTKYTQKSPLSQFPSTARDQRVFGKMGMFKPAVSASCYVFSGGCAEYVQRDYLEI